MAARVEPVVGGTEAEDILLKDFTHELRLGYVRAFPHGEVAKLSGKGYLFPERFSEFEAQIRELEMRPEDVWVASYPKCGTTWTQEMVWCICNDMDLERAKSLCIRLRFPFLEKSLMTRHRSEPGEENTLEQMYLENSVRFISNFPSPRFIKTHCPWDLLPEKLEAKKPKIVYVARNPKETCVSYFHHCSVLEGYRGSFSEFVTLFLEDSVSFSPYWDHLLSYWEHKDDSNVLFLTYEEMKKDLPSVICRVSKFMDKKQPTEEDLKVLCDHLSFDSMKSNGMVNYEAFLKKEHSTSNFKFIRKGKVDSWKEEMSPEDVKRFDSWIEENLKKIGAEAEEFFRKSFNIGVGGD